MFAQDAELTRQTLWIAVTAAACLLLAVVVPAWSRRRAGPILFTLGRPCLKLSPRLLLAGLHGMFVAVFVVLALGHHRGSPMGELLGLAGAMMSGASPASLMLGSWRVTPSGLSIPYGTIKWDRVRSYAWEYAWDREMGTTLALRLHLSPWFDERFVWYVPPVEKDVILGLLHRYARSAQAIEE